MDTVLPKELAIQILSYLPKEDVIQCKGVNKNFKKLIIENSGYLNYQEIEIKFRDSTKNKKAFEMWINDKKMLHVINVGDGMVEIEDQVGSRQTTICDGPQNLRRFFDSMLDKGDLHLKMNCMNKMEGLTTFIEAIKATSSLIRSIEINLLSDDFDQLCDLLAAIGEHKRKTKKLPTGNFNLNIETDPTIRRRVARLNDLVANFGRCILNVVNERDMELIHLMRKKKFNLEVVGAYGDHAYNNSEERAERALMGLFEMIVSGRRPWMDNYVVDEEDHDPNELRVIGPHYIPVEVIPDFREV